MNASEIRRDVLVCLALSVGTLAVFWQVRGHEFTAFDDNVYVYENQYVRDGLTPDTAAWAFTRIHHANWIPLTLMSHMLDCELYGLRPGGHHLTSLLLHVASTVALFLVLKQMTQAAWRSAFVAALFAIHPLHVEPVAWIASRKDVLSTLFWVLTMGAYAQYARCPGLPRYILVTALFAMGLMAKPMLVTLPFVLLLLDYWPLGRLVAGECAGRNAGRLFGKRVLEKAPLLGLAAACIVVTYIGQGRRPASTLGEFPFSLRLANGAVSYVRYMAKMVWPTRLAVFYPYPREPWSAWQSCAAVLCLAGLTLVVLRLRRRPYLVVGWLWYVVTLVPVSGAVYIGRHAMADRYTYVPLIGLFIIVAWGASDFAGRWPRCAKALAVSCAAVVAALMCAAWVQVGHWRTSVTLLEHALRVTSDNWLAHNNLGYVLRSKGRLHEAMEHFNATLEIDPMSVLARANLADILADQGKLDEAIALYSEAIRIRPDYAKAHTNLGILLARQGKLDEALEHFEEAVSLDPENAEARFNLGNALFNQGKMGEAEPHLSESLRRRADNAVAHVQLGMILARQGKPDEAISHYTEAIRIDPDSDLAHLQLGVTLGRTGRLDEAAVHFSRALDLNPASAEAHFNLGSVLLTRGELHEAAAHFADVLRVWPDNFEAHVQLGTVLEKQGKLAHAAEHFSMALRIRPGDDAARAHLERIKAEQLAQQEDSKKD